MTTRALWQPCVLPIELAQKYRYLSEFNEPPEDRLFYTGSNGDVPPPVVARLHEPTRVNLATCRTVDQNMIIFWTQFLNKFIFFGFFCFLFCLNQDYKQAG